MRPSLEHPDDRLIQPTALKVQQMGGGEYLRGTYGVGSLGILTDFEKLPNVMLTNYFIDW